MDNLNKNKRYKVGRYSQGSGRFTEKEIVKNEDGSISMCQSPYIQEKVHQIKLYDDDKCTEDEISSLLGTLAWVGEATRASRP